MTWRRRTPQRLVRLLEALGGSFIKFGQLLSMRPDILPMRYCDALGQLYDNVGPFPIPEVKRIIEGELRAPMDELFLEFDERPLGAATFGQVHRVVLGRGADRGTACVIKIQRPGAAEQLDVDSRWLKIIGHFVDASSLLGQIKLTPVFKDFVRWTAREVNFTQEAKNADRLFEETEWNIRQRIPYVYWDYTTRRVMTMEFLQGMPVSEIIRRLEDGDPYLDEDLQEMGCSRLEIAASIYQNFYLQAFIGEIFHGDPHPGNLIVLPNNVIGYVDFGLLGRMSPEALREQIIFIDAVVKKDIEKMFVAILDILDAPRGLLVSDYFDEFYEFADAWLDASDNPGASLTEKSANNFVNAALELARGIGLPLSMNTTLYYKALLATDTCILRLAPEVDYHQVIRGGLRMVRVRKLEKMLSPNAALDRALDTWLLALSLPEFVSEQLLTYQQATRAMYRKINQLPLVAAATCRSLAATLALAALALLPVNLHYTDHLPVAITKAMHIDQLQALAAWSPAMFGGALALIWIARLFKGQSLQKVQRDRG